MTAAAASLECGGLAAAFTDEVRLKLLRITENVLPLARFVFEQTWSLLE